MVDRLTKYYYIILFNEKYTVEQLGIIMLNTLIWYYKIQKGIGSNRSKSFSSNY